MTEPSISPSTPPPTGDARVAGARLQAAREAQGLSLDHLAASLKVTEAKLAALERGDLDQLPDANFARALAKTVCRQLQIDPTPVLAELPASRMIPLGPDREPLNQPFKERRSTGPLFDRAGKGADFGVLLSARWVAPLVLLLAALVVYLLPEQIERPSWWPAATVASSATSAPAATVQTDPSASEPLFAPADAGAEPAATGSDPVPAPLTPESIAPPQIAASSSEVPAPAAPAPEPTTAPTALPPEGATLVGLRAVEDAWIEVRDARGKKVFSGRLKAGQTASVDGAAPMRLRIGNATHVQLTHKGQPVDLAAHTRNNIARLELP
ncbi:helix-turn-helix domain-containing protein [uncultured Aquabacterium sp.]|uniref:helix-turn-helix domain-containing protein n=1 Tax=uncultured Aquabacterium sp. TaxID=158753 RepID=UPI0026139CD2|nr:helix-turn-helix domain-containing protein [uncultured Aquabacterium sp.]